MTRLGRWRVASRDELAVMIAHMLDTGRSVGQAEQRGEPVDVDERTPP